MQKEEIQHIFTKSGRISKYYDFSQGELRLLNEKSDYYQKLVYVIDKRIPRSLTEYFECAKCHSILKPIYNAFRRQEFHCKTCNIKSHFTQCIR